MQGTVPAIRSGWRAASAHDTATRAMIGQARAQGRAGLGVLGGRRTVAGRSAGADRRAAGGARGRLGERQQARGVWEQARGTRSRCADTAWTRGGARQVQAGARGAAG